MAAARVQQKAYTSWIVFIGTTTVRDQRERPGMSASTMSSALPEALSRKISLSTAACSSFSVSEVSLTTIRGAGLRRLAVWAAGNNHVVVVVVKVIIAHNSRGRNIFHVHFWFVIATYKVDYVVNIAARLAIVALSSFVDNFFYLAIEDKLLNWFKCRKWFERNKVNSLREKSASYLYQPVEQSIGSCKILKSNYVDKTNGTCHTTEIASTCNARSEELKKAEWYWLKILFNWDNLPNKTWKSARQW